MILISVFYEKCPLVWRGTDGIHLGFLQREYMRKETEKPPGDLLLKTYLPGSYKYNRVVVQRPTTLLTSVERGKQLRCVEPFFSLFYSNPQPLVTPSYLRSHVTILVSSISNRRYMLEQTPVICLAVNARRPWSFVSSNILFLTDSQHHVIQTPHSGPLRLESIHAPTKVSDTFVEVMDSCISQRGCATVSMMWAFLFVQTASWWIRA